MRNPWTKASEPKLLAMTSKQRSRHSIAESRTHSAPQRAERPEVGAADTAGSDPQQHLSVPGLGSGKLGRLERDQFRREHHRMHRLEILSR